MWFTLWQAVASTALTLLVGLTPAYVFSRYRFPGRTLLLGLMTALFVLPTVVMGAAILAVAPDSIDHTVWAVLIAHVIFNLAVVVRVVGALWERLPARHGGGGRDARRIAGRGVPPRHPGRSCVRQSWVRPRSCSSSRSRRTA